MAGKIKGITIEIGGNTQPLNKALADVNKKSKDLQSELRQVERLLKLDPGNTELLAQKQKLLAEAVQNSKEKLDRLKTAQQQVNEQFAKGEISEEQYRAFQREVVKAEQDLEKFERQLSATVKTTETWQQKLDKASNSLKNAGAKMTSVGKDLAMKVTAPIAAIGAVATKTGMEFEAAMSEVGAISGASAKDLEALEAKAKEMGSTTKFSASEAADGLKYMAMAGWDTTKMMEGLPGILNLAAASGEELGAVSDIVTDAMTAFGMEAKRAGEFADTLAAASSSSNTNVGLLGESFKYVAPVAGALGFAAKDTAVALGLMANAGIKGSQSGSALRTILTNMAKPTAQMQKAMTEYGISLTHADGSMKSLDEVMLNLRSSLGGLTEAEQAAAAAAIFGKEAMSGALAIVNTSEADFNKLSDAINGSAGAADRMSKEMQDNLQGRLTELKSAIEGVALQLYDAMKPALEAMVAVVQKIVDWIAKLSPEMQTAIVVIAGLAAAVGPLLIVLGFMASGLGSILTILPALGAAFTVITGPIGIAVAAIAALVAGLVHLYRTNEDIRANMQVVWEAIKVVLDVAMKAILFVIKSVWDNIKGVISGALNVIQGVINVFAGILTGDFGAMWEGIKQIFSGAVEFIFNFIQLMFIGKIMAIFKNFAKAGFELLKGNWANILNGVKQFGTNILNLFKGLWDSTIGTFNTFRSTGTNIINALRNTLTSIVQGLVSAVKSLFSGMSSSVASIMSSLRISIQTIWNNIKATASSVWNGIKSAILNPIESAKNTIMNIITTIKNAFANMKITIPKPKLPHISVSTKYKSVGEIRIPYPDFDLNWYKTGGIFARPSVIGVGEAGKEAVIPLDKLPGMISSALREAMGGSDQLAMAGGAMITGNNFYVRNDNDIKLVARELYNLQQTNARGRGLK